MKRGGAIAGCHGLPGYDKDVRSFMGLSGVFWTVRERQGQGGERGCSGLQEFVRDWRM